MKSPFYNISEKEKKKILQLLQVHIYMYNKGQSILSTMKNNNIIGIISKGYAEIININYNGEKTTIEELYEDSVFGTIISSIDTKEYEIIAKEQTEVIIIDYDRLFDKTNLEKRYYNEFILNMYSIINDKLQEKNERIRILTKKTIRNKLLEYFKIQYSKNHSKHIYLPYNFSDLADYLAVDRSAMSRELKYMKEEGFIEVKGKRITILY